MHAHLDHPLTVFVIALVAQGIAVFVGDFLRRHTHQFRQGERHDFATIQAATLTLLALITGFSFSMAVTRYDQRKTLEEAEANAIGTAYLRADLLPGDVAPRARDTLRKYLQERIAFYEEGDEHAASEIGRRTTALQDELWASVLPATNTPTPITALAIAAMNDVINAQGFTQAAWWNRIPIGAWAMMLLMAISCNLLVGYGEQRKEVLALFILPVVISVAYFLIADLDSPRGGTIRVIPQNLRTAAQVMTPR
jgi:protein-S-isoprenylcysteine O-methyltransferase Ste14